MQCAPARGMGNNRNAMICVGRTSLVTLCMCCAGVGSSGARGKEGGEERGQSHSAAGAEGAAEGAAAAGVSVSPTWDLACALDTHNA